MRILRPLHYFIDCLRIGTIDLLKHRQQENKMQKMTSEQLIAHIDSVIENYEGDSDVLFSSIGALMVGRKYGYRVLMIVSSSVSYSKYQKILGLQFKDVMDETTLLSRRSLGYRIVEKLNNFWAVVRGSYSIDRNEKRRFESIATNT